MKEKELREAAVCALCGNKIGTSGLPFFWRVRVRRYGVNMPALQRQQGLTMMLNGHAGLASVMGPDEDLAKKMMETEFTICEACTITQVCVGQMAEINGDQEEP